MVLRDSVKTVGALISITEIVLRKLRRRSVVSESERQAIQIEVEKLRAIKISESLTELGIRNMQLTIELYDAAELRSGMPDYAQALETAGLTARLLRKNMDTFARKVL